MTRVILHDSVANLLEHVEPTDNIVEANPELQFTFADLEHPKLVPAVSLFLSGRVDDLLNSLSRLQRAGAQFAQPRLRFRLQSLEGLRPEIQGRTHRGVAPPGKLLLSLLFDEVGVGFEAVMEFGQVSR